eukprot:TRINITY_DN14893_c0_g1_i1.p1 TRINITY_DN14893_c0_g1~~TRINITY_DN14893_c0_g1_i1.p1  ORF type:complete len:227 (-),score=18.31 TRINITY_DN14893_c0_g1_i1:98-778(-)
MARGGCNNRKLPFHLSVIQYSLVFINVLFFIIGILLISLGGVGLLKSIPLISIPSLATGLMILGAVVLLITFFGCCGAYCQSRFVMIVYIAVLIIIVIIQVSIAIAASVASHKVETTAQLLWEKANPSDKIAFEKEFKCCGFANTTDSPGSNCTNLNVTLGCYQAVKDIITSKMKVIEITAGVLAAFEVVGLIFAIVLCRLLPRKDRFAEEVQVLRPSARRGQYDL